MTSSPTDHARETLDPIQARCADGKAGRAPYVDGRGQGDRDAVPDARRFAR